jgi:PAS domain S-box-containing protein
VQTARSVSVQRRFQAAFVFAVLALAAVAAVNLQSNAGRRDALARARYISLTRGQTESLFGVLVDQESAVQGFLATAGQESLNVSGQAREQALLNTLRPLVATRPSERADLQAVISASAAWHAASARDVAATRARSRLPLGATNSTAADRTGQDLARGQEHQRLFDGLHRSVERLQTATDAARGRASTTFDAAEARVTRVLYASLVATGALLGLLLLLVRRWVLTPLATITTAVRTVGDGAFDDAIPVVGPPELARLGLDVDAMRRRVLSETDIALRANAALLEAEAQLRLLFNNVRDYAILRLDPSGVIMSWNTGAEQMTGYRAEDAVGRPGQMMRLEGVSDEVPFADNLARAAAEGTMELQSWLERADGAQIMVASTVTTIWAGDGSIQGYAVISRDVTAAVEAEAALTHAHQQLAERAEEFEHSNTLLQNANDDLLAANQELEAFSYSISHDLRAPLRSINAYSSILLQDHGQQLNPEAAGYLDRIAHSAERMGQLIDDLLEFSKLLRVSMIKTSTPLADVAQQAWDLVAPESAGQDVVLEIGQLPSVMADPRMLKQVFVNLLSNAVKFSATRHPARITIECDPNSPRDPSSPGGGQPVITVRDNGIGFDTEYADGLFGVFKRLHTAGEFEGTGIGLSIVHRIITRHGGRVWASGQRDQGAAFSFTLGPGVPRIPTQPSPLKHGRRAQRA